MKVVKLNSKGIEAKIIQSMLNLHLTKDGVLLPSVKTDNYYKQYKSQLGEFLPLKIDGNFGKKSEASLKVFQSLAKLQIDGKAGPATQRALWILPSSKSNIVTIQFPLKNIARQCVVNHSGNSSSTLPKCVKEVRGNVGSNAGMFNNTSKGNLPYVLLNETLDNGQPIKASNGAIIGGNYLHEGLALCNDRVKGSVYYSTVENSKNKPVDFVGCNELLIENYQKVMKITPNLGNSFMKQKTAWFAWGVDDNYLYYMTNLTNTPLNDLAVEGQAQHIKHLLSYDGGGSRCFYVTDSVFATSRPIPQCFVFDINGRFA